MQAMCHVCHVVATRRSRQRSAAGLRRARADRTHARAIFGNRSQFARTRVLAARRLARFPRHRSRRPRHENCRLRRCFNTSRIRSNVVTIAADAILSTGLGPRAAPPPMPLVGQPRRRSGHFVARLSPRHRQAAAARSARRLSGCAVDRRLRLVSDDRCDTTVQAAAVFCRLVVGPRRRARRRLAALRLAPERSGRTPLLSNQLRP